MAADVIVRLKYRWGIDNGDDDNDSDGDVNGTGSREKQDTCTTMALNKNSRRQR